MNLVIVTKCSLNYNQQDAILKTNQVELGDVPNGMYLVVIYTETGEKTVKKLVIAK